MPNSTTKIPSSSLTFPGTAASVGFVERGPPLHAYIESAMEGIEDYARREPWSFAAWVFGLGFVLGWKLKPW